MQKRVCFFSYLWKYCQFSVLFQTLYRPVKLNLQSIEQIRNVLSDLFVTKFISLLRI